MTEHWEMTRGQQKEVSTAESKRLEDDDDEAEEAEDN